MDGVCRTGCVYSLLNSPNQVFELLIIKETPYKREKLLPMVLRLDDFGEGLMKFFHM